jgi:hypothetical protein
MSIKSCITFNFCRSPLWRERQAARRKGPTPGGQVPAGGVALCGSEAAREPPVQRADFEEAWGAYCPGQNTLRAHPPDREACRRASAEEMGTTGDFRSVPENILHGSKDGKLSTFHAGLHACTGNGRMDWGRGDSDHGVPTLDDGLDIPDNLLRSPPGATCAEREEAGGELEPERANGRLEAAPKVSAVPPGQSSDGPQSALPEGFGPERYPEDRSVIMARTPSVFRNRKRRKVKTTA